MEIDPVNRYATVLTYEYEKNAPVGFSIGKYKDHKSNGYFTLRLNSNVFEALRTNNGKPEVNVSFGWTINVVYPVWIFLGPGYTGVGQYTANNSDTQKADINHNLKIKSAVSPEIGLLVKLINKKIGVGLALRYTFQYHYALDKEYIDDIGKTKHVFGIGLCF